MDSERVTWNLVGIAFCSIILPGTIVNRGPTTHTKTYILPYLYEQYFVLFTKYRTTVIGKTLSLTPPPLPSPPSFSAAVCVVSRFLFAVTKISLWFVVSFLLPSRNPQRRHRAVRRNMCRRWGSSTLRRLPPPRASTGFLKSCST